jgi:hypothetical protein
MDCRALLGLTRLLTEQSPAGERPCQRIRAVWVTHYKDMGQSHTVMRMEQLALPQWADASSLHALDEHEVAVRRLNDSRCDEFHLLNRYRQTLQSHPAGSAAHFVEFLAGYNELLFRSRAEGEWLLPQFSWAGIAPALRGHAALSEAPAHPGFTVVAAAIRSSTFSAQTARRNNNPQHREIRYGLPGVLRRAGVRGKAELSDAVQAFAAQFNRESARRRSAGLAAAHIREHEFAAFSEWLGSMPSGAIAASLLSGFAGALRNGNREKELEGLLVHAAQS